LHPCALAFAILRFCKNEITDLQKISLFPQKGKGFFIVIFHALFAEKQQKSTENPQLCDSIFPTHDDYSTVILEDSIF